MKQAMPGLLGLQRILPLPAVGPSSSGPQKRDWAPKERDDGSKRVNQGGNLKGLCWGPVCSKVKTCLRPTEPRSNGVQRLTTAHA